MYLQSMAEEFNSRLDLEEIQLITSNPVPLTNPLVFFMKLEATLRLKQLLLIDKQVKMKYFYPDGLV